MDLMRNIISQELETSDRLSMIKKQLDSIYQGKWSVVYGMKFSTYLDAKYFKEFMWFQSGS